MRARSDGSAWSCVAHGALGASGALQPAGLDGDGVPVLGLGEVVGDDGFELGHGGQAAFDEIAAPVAVGRDVGQADDAEDALAHDDPLAGGDAVARELARRVGGPSVVRTGRCSGGHHGSPSWFSARWRWRRSR